MMDIQMTLTHQDYIVHLLKTKNNQSWKRILYSFVRALVKINLATNSYF